MRFLQLARRLMANGVARDLREGSGYSRAEFARGQPYTVAALIAWEMKRRRPSGEQGIALGKQLAGLMQEGALAS